MLSVLITLALCPQSPPADAAKTVFETLSLEHLCGERNAIYPPQWGSMLTFSTVDDSSARPDLLETRDGAQFDSGQIVDLLRSLHSVACENGSLRLDLQDTSLQLFGDAPTLAMVREEIKQLSAVVARPIQIEVGWWDAGSGPAANALLGPKEYNEFAAQHTLLWRSRSETCSSFPVALDQQRWSRYVRDVRVEVAQKAHTSSPGTDAFGEGGRVVVLPHSVIGGDDLVVQVQFGLAERRGPVQSMPTGVPGQVDLELPQLETYFGACSGRITNGGALAVSMTGSPNSGGNRVLTIRAQCKMPPATQGSTSLGVFPISAMSKQGLTQRLTPPDPYPVIGDRVAARQDVAGESLGFGCLPADRLIELVQAALGADAEENFLITSTGGFLLVHADPQKVARTEAVLHSLQESILQTVTVHHSGRIAAAGARGSGATPVPLHDLVAPTLLGRYLTLCRMFETNVLRDVIVEIAQEATDSSPVVEPLQIGAWLRARATPTDTGMHLSLLLQCANGEVPASRRIAPVGALMPTSLASTRVGHNGTVVNGVAVDHGDGPGMPDGSRSDLVTTVSW